MNKLTLGLTGNAMALGLYIPTVGVYVAVFSVLFLEAWYVLIAARCTGSAMAAPARGRRIVEPHDNTPCDRRLSRAPYRVRRAGCHSSTWMMHTAAPRRAASSRARRSAAWAVCEPS